MNTNPGGTFDAPRHRIVGAQGRLTPLEDPADRVLRAWDLDSGEEETYSISHLTDDPTITVSPEPLHEAGRALYALSSDRRRLLVWAGRNAGAGVFEDLFLFDLDAGTSRRITTHGDRLWTAAFDPSGHAVVSGDIAGVVRVGPASGEEPHLLLGHGGWVMAVDVSPDGRWIASVSEDGLSLWPMPDVTKPPLHTLPLDALLAKLETFTNLHVAEDETAPTGYRVDVGPFPGWKDVPTW